MGILLILSLIFIYIIGYVFVFLKLYDQFDCDIDYDDSGVTGAAFLSFIWPLVLLVSFVRRSLIADWDE